MRYPSLHRMLVPSMVALSLGQFVIADAPDSKFKATTPVIQDAPWAVEWWMPRHKQKLKEIENQPPIDLVLIGDSITHGFEGQGREVWSQYYEPRRALNLGFSGDRTEHVLWRLQHDAVQGISPKLVVIMIGTNNTGHRQDPPEETAAGIGAIIDELKTRLPEAKLLLLAIFPRDEDNDGPLRQINEKTNQLIADFADDDRVHFLNINEEFLDENGGLPKEVMPDLLHPNAQGYEIWAKAMEPKISQLMD